MADVVIKATKMAKKQGKRGKQPDKRPARKRYWNARHLEKTKIRCMMKAYGLSKKDALRRWHAERKTLVPLGYVSDNSNGKANTHKKSA